MDVRVEDAELSVGRHGVTLKLNDQLQRASKAAPGSVWPTFAFDATDSQRLRALSRFERKIALKAPASIGSPSEVPVPCVSRTAT